MQIDAADRSGMMQRNARVCGVLLQVLPIQGVRGKCYTEYSKGKYSLPLAR